MGIRLNLGCGYRHEPQIEGWINVDADVACKPDLQAVLDIESYSWPWAQSVVSEVQFIHALEHMGPVPSRFLWLMKELWRVCIPDAIVRIVVPHPRSDQFLIDPTHCRPLLPETFEHFSAPANRRWKEKGFPNSCLALALGIDFELVEAIAKVAQPPASAQEAELLKLRSRRENNVIEEFQMKLQVFKPMRQE